MPSRPILTFLSLRLSPARSRRLPDTLLAPGSSFAGSCRFSSDSLSPRREVLLNKLEAALDDQKIQLAWKAFKSYRKLYGFPDISITGRLITCLSYSSDPNSLQNAIGLVFLHLQKKRGLFRLDVLAKLALSSARAQLPIPASKILRLLLEKNSLPPLNVLSLIVLQMVKTESGACLAANFLIQLCDDLSNKVKPDTSILNLVLDACVRFKLSMKGQELIELMARVKVVADANSLVILSHIYEMNGQRDEIAKYKDIVNRVSVPVLARHYRQFYDCLLSLHFKFNDIDSAAELLQNVCRDRGKTPSVEVTKHHFVPVGSHNLKNGLKILIEPEKFDESHSILEVHEEKYITVTDGKLGISRIALTKLIYGYKKNGKVDELSRFLYSIRDHINLIDVVNACIHAGWLETAHDILDDAESAGSRLHPATYFSLLESYKSEGMIREAKGLVKQMQKAGLVSDSSSEITASTLLDGGVKRRSEFSVPLKRTDLGELLVREMKEEEKDVPSVVYEVNSSIRFFCKAKMMGDSLRTYRRMQEMNLQPTEQTFADMLSGYSSMKMYRDITILWGDIKRNILNGNLVIGRDLCESLLLNFIRGGYFERVMEVVTLMEKENMFVDKGMCKWEYMKLHKNLYRRLKASETTTEAQEKRLECVKDFRKWMFNA